MPSKWTDDQRSSYVSQSQHIDTSPHQNPKSVRCEFQDSSQNESAGSYLI
jgi:hypothetical protein